MQIQSYTKGQSLETEERSEIRNFLHTQLEKYGDSPSAIDKAIAYALGEEGKPGGYIFCLREAGELLGAVVLNKTGMQEYIPENILVYIATHAEHRGKGLGKQLMQHCLSHCEGDIALHVEKDNPAKHLYEKLGFQTPYLEMRLKR